jgi:hypothetical protein
MKSERGPTLTSLVSPSTVVHHCVANDEYWSVFNGTTAVAYCTSAEQARELADTLNDARQAGDQYVLTRHYTPTGAPVHGVHTSRAPAERISQ